MSPKIISLAIVSLLSVGCGASMEACEQYAREQALAEDTWGDALGEHAALDELAATTDDEYVSEQHALDHERLLEARTAVIVATAKATDSCRA